MHSESELLPLRRKVAKFEGEDKILTNDSHPYSPTFAVLAPLREILRALVAALPRWAFVVNSVFIFIANLVR